MKTEYKHIYFANVSYLYPERKTRVWECQSNSTDIVLGRIKWHSPWRQYCFFSEDDTLFSKNCLLDIIDFIEQINEDREKRHIL